MRGFPDVSSFMSSGPEDIPEHDGSSGLSMQDILNRQNRDLTECTEKVVVCISPSPLHPRLVIGLTLNPVRYYTSLYLRRPRCFLSFIITLFLFASHYLIL